MAKEVQKQKTRPQVSKGLADVPFKVKARSSGAYHSRTRDPGDVFVVDQASHFEQWMERVIDVDPSLSIQEQESLAAQREKELDAAARGSVGHKHTPVPPRYPSD